jgi:dihydrofolate reductase
MLSLIAVIGRNRELGYENGLIWHIPGDLPRFKQITWGHPVIMGRKTHSTFQYKGGPLPGRTNIVLTHNRSFRKEGFTVVHTWEDAVSAAEKSPGSEEIFIIGGGQVFAKSISQSDRLYLTVVDASGQADTFFPDYSMFRREISKEDHVAEDMKYTYYILEK